MLISFTPCALINAGLFLQMQMEQMLLSGLPCSTAQEGGSVRELDYSVCLEQHHPPLLACFSPYQIPNLIQKQAVFSLIYFRKFHHVPIFQEEDSILKFAKQVT